MFYLNLYIMAMDTARAVYENSVREREAGRLTNSAYYQFLSQACYAQARRYRNLFEEKKAPGV